jgi:hypothetical protein
LGSGRANAQVALPAASAWRRSGRALALGGVLLIWSLLPAYNMLLIALDPEGDTEFAGYLAHRGVT